MIKILESIQTNNDLIRDDNFIVHNLLDPLTDFVKDFLETNIRLLNSSRILLRKGDKISYSDGIKKYALFKENWIEAIKNNDTLERYYPGHKCIEALADLLRKSTTRDILAKIPQTPIDYLTHENLNEADLDWIIKKINDYSSKFYQTYSSSRIVHILKMDK